MIRQGERVTAVLENQTMMWHPMHLHGHFFRVLPPAGADSLEAGTARVFRYEV